MLKTRFKIRSTYAVNAYAFEGIYTYQQWCCKREQCNEARHRWECHQWTWTFWCWIDQLMNRHFVQLAMMDRLKILVDYAVIWFFGLVRVPKTSRVSETSSIFWDRYEFMWPVKVSRNSPGLRVLWTSPSLMNSGWVQVYYLWQGIDFW